MVSRQQADTETAGQGPKLPVVMQTAGGSLSLFFRSLLLFSSETGGSPGSSAQGGAALGDFPPSPSAHRSHLQMTLPGSVRGLRTYFVTLLPSAFLCVCLSPGPASQLAPPGTEGLEQKGALPAPHPAPGARLEDKGRPCPPSCLAVLSPQDSPLFPETGPRAGCGASRKDTVSPLSCLLLPALWEDTVLGMSFLLFFVCLFFPSDV